MDVSVVIATHNQQERLRLVLAGLAGQSFPRDRFEVIVVDDGSTDTTAQFLAAFDPPFQMRVITLQPNQGRCHARNAGVAAAQGEVVAFLDGDALPHPDWLCHHAAAREQYGPDTILCGAEYSLAGTEFLQDPQSGTVVAGTPSVVREHLRNHQSEAMVTEAMILTGFSEIEARSREGGYPFPMSATIQQQTRILLTEHPDSPVAWIAFYPHNAMVPRAAFENGEGFDAQMPFSEGWELAYRLQQAGHIAHFVDQARTYHLYHRHGFTDPRQQGEENRVRREAVARMADKHRERRFYLLWLWQLGLAGDPFVPEELLPVDLSDLHERWQGITVEQLRDLGLLVARHPEQEVAEAEHMLPSD